MVIPTAFAGAQSSSTATAPRAVATSFADGRRTHYIIKPEGTGGWTTLFPRIAGADTDRNGLPLAALDVVMVPDGQNVKVGVTLIYGRPHQHRIPVAQVNVTPGGTVHVDQLVTYGVEPVAFSIVPVPPSVLKAPTVTSVSAALEGRVELAREDGPTYRLILVNQSTQAARGFGIEGTRAGRKSTSAYRRGQRHAMLIPPGEAISMEVPTSVIQGVGGPTRISPDVMVITSVSWEDGTVEGDKAPAAIEQVIAEGSARQLAHVIALLREAGDVLRPQGLPELRGRIAALPIEVSRGTADEARWLRTGMEQVKQLAVRDLDAFVNQPGRGSAALWVSQTIVEYEQWLARAKDASAPRVR